MFPRSSSSVFPSAWSGRSFTPRFADGQPGVLRAPLPPLATPAHTRDARRRIVGEMARDLRPTTGETLPRLDEVLVAVESGDAWPRLYQEGSTPHRRLAVRTGNSSRAPRRNGCGVMPMWRRKPLVRTRLFTDEEIRKTTDWAIESRKGQPVEMKVLGGPTIPPT